MVEGKRRKRATESQICPYVMALIPSMRVPPSWPNHCPNVATPNTVTIAIKFQMSSRGDIYTMPVLSKHMIKTLMKKFCKFQNNQLFIFFQITNIICIRNLK
jgi:hypothetical protein